MRYAILLAMTLTAGCRLAPLEIDPCTIMPEVETCYAIPLNQSGKQEYERPLRPGDVCVTSEEYAEIQKRFRELLERCGEKCAR